MPYFDFSRKVNFFTFAINELNFDYFFDSNLTLTQVLVFLSFALFNRYLCK